jgi:hypothetical protein
MGYPNPASDYQDQPQHRLGLVCQSLVEIEMGWVGLCIPPDVWLVKNH